MVIGHRSSPRRGADPDAELVSRARAGDLSAFDCLVRRYQDPMVSTAYQMLGDLDRAHDAVQEAFVRAFRALSRFEGRSTFSTWLYSIVYRQCLDELRRQRRHPVSLDHSPHGTDAESLEVPDPEADPARHVERLEQSTMVRRALARLPEHLRAVLILAELRGLSYEEIAQVIHRPLGTVKSRLARARDALQRGLEREAEHFDLP